MNTTRTTRAMGRTKCPGCEQALMAGQEVTEIATTERGYGTSPSGKTYIREVPATVRWHTECVRDFEARNEVSREDVRVQNLVDLYRAFVAPGVITEGAFVASARKNGHDDTRIARAIEEGCVE